MHFSHNNMTYVTKRGCLPDWYLGFKSGSTSMEAYSFPWCCPPSADSKKVSTSAFMGLKGVRRSVPLPSCLWPIRGVRYRHVRAQPIRVSWGTAARTILWCHAGNNLFPGDFLEFTIKRHELKNVKQKELRWIAGHIVSRFNGVYFCIAVDWGKRFFGAQRIFLLQYLEWPLGKMSTPPYCHPVPSFYHTSIICISATKFILNHFSHLISNNKIDIYFIV